MRGHPSSSRFGESRLRGPRDPKGQRGVGKNDSREDKINRVREVTQEVTWLLLSRIAPYRRLSPSLAFVMFLLLFPRVYLNLPPKRLALVKKKKRGGGERA